MPEIEVLIFNHKLKLSYQDNEKQRLINAVEALNKIWNKFSDLQGKVSDLKIITLISLELQDSLESKNSIRDEEAQLINKIELLQKEIISKNAQIEENLQKYKSVLDEKKHEISKVEIILDELNIEVSKIKNNILKK